MTGADFGTVQHLGVERQFDLPGHTVFVLKGLPGYPKELLQGTETAAELAKPFIVSVLQKSPRQVLTTGGFDDEDAAVAEVKAKLADRGVSAGRRGRIRNRMTLRSGDVASEMRRYRNIDTE